MPLPPEYRLHSLNNTLDIVERLALESRDLGVSELATAVGLSKGATHKILANLVERGYVEALETGRYRLGLRLWEMGQRVPRQRRLRDAAVPHMHELMERLHESVILAIYDRGDVVYVERAATDRGVQTYTATGARGDAHAAASGKVLLAFQSERERERYLTRDLVRYTDNTITSPDVLASALAQVRQAGYAINIGERQPDVNGISAPIRDASGDVVAALSVTGPAYRFTPKVVSDAAGPLSDCAERISESLGHRPHQV